MSKRGQWVEMGELIDDDVLDAFAVTGEPKEIAGKIAARYGGIVDSWLGSVNTKDESVMPALIETLQAVPGAA
jgi:hypothetical protein